MNQSAETGNMEKVYFKEIYKESMTFPNSRINPISTLTIFKSSNKEVKTPKEKGLSKIIK